MRPVDIPQELRGVADIELHTDIATDAWADCGVPQWLQCEGDLGLKLLQALSGALPRNTANIIGMSAERVLKEGDRAPEIRLQDDQGNPFELSKLQGKNVVLYFYPKADTSGCTLESKEFSANAAEFAKRDAVIVGVSPDKIEAQCKFKTKYEFPFALLADVDHYAADAYGVWTEKSMYGRKYMGIERSTFLIGKDGRIKKVFSKVKPAGHAAEVLDALTSDE